MWISQLQPHQCTRSSSLPCFWLWCCFAGRLHSPVLKKERLSLQSFSYWLPPMHKLGIFTWKTVGSSLLCITWKSYSFLCMLCFTEICSAHYGHGNPHPMPPPASLAEKVVFHCTSTETSKVKERTPFPARFASEKKEQEKKRSNVLLCPSPCWILNSYSHWGKQAEMLWMHMSASWFFFQKCNIPLFLALCMTANSSLCLPGSSATHLSKFFCLVLSSFSLGNTCHFLALISLGL